MVPARTGPRADASARSFARGAPPHRARIRRRRRGRLLDPRHPALRRRAACPLRGATKLRAALPAPRHDDLARSVLQYRLQVRRHLLERTVSRRAWPSGSRNCAVAKRHCVRSRLAGPTTTTSGWSTTGRCRIRTVPRPGSVRAAAVPGAPNWLLPVAAAMLTETSDRTAARYLWRQILESDEDWLRKRAERGLLQLDALDQIDRLSAVIASAASGGGRAVFVARAGACRHATRNSCRSRRDSVRNRSRDRPRHGFNGVPTVPDACIQGTSALTFSAVELIIVALAGLAIGSFLNVVIYRLPRKESVVSPGSACPAVRDATALA